MFLALSWQINFINKHKAVNVYQYILSLYIFYVCFVNFLLRSIHTRCFAPGACSAPGSFCMCQYTRGSVFKFAQFAPGACSQIFNLLNIVEHFAGWKFCSRHTEELCFRSVPVENATGAKSLLCIGLKARLSPQWFWTTSETPLLVQGEWGKGGGGVVCWRGEALGTWTSVRG